MALNPGEVKTENIANAAVTTPKIANNSITGEKIGTAQVTVDKLSSGAVTTPKIATGAVTAYLLKRALNMREARQEVREISAKYGLEVDPDALIEEIPVGVQQRVEIIKVLFRDAEVLVFDEPTAVLTPQEVEEFFGILRGLRDAGKAIVFITHKLKEVIEISDRIAVIRRGRVVGERTPTTTDEATLAEMMVGRPVELTVHKEPARPGDLVLEVDDLIVLDDRDHAQVNGVSLTARAGVLDTPGR